MACELLGESFDIHGGGADLQFPHHENEITQSEAANDKPLARYWMHNGFVTRDYEKMSKSLGNFFTIQEILARFDAESTRFFVVRSHYRSALNYSDAHIEDARTALKRLYTSLQTVPPQSEPMVIDWSAPYADRFKAAMDQDFGTPEAVAVLFDLASEVNRSGSPQLSALLRALGAVLGLLQSLPEVFLRAGNSVDAIHIDTLITERQTAKAERDFARADAIRAELLAQGIVLKDSAQGTTWEATTV